jgi:hypothetical protein
VSSTLPQRVVGVHMTIPRACLHERVVRCVEAYDDACACDPISLASTLFQQPSSTTQKAAIGQAIAGHSLAHPFENCRQYQHACPRNQIPPALTLTHRPMRDVETMRGSHSVRGTADGSPTRSRARQHLTCTHQRVPGQSFANGKKLAKLEPKLEPKLEL